MGLLRELLRAGRAYGPDALNTIRQQVRAGGANLGQVEQALKTFAVTAQQEGNVLGRRILQRIDPQLQRVLDAEQQTRTAGALSRMDQQRALRRAAQVGRPAPKPEWGQRPALPAASQKPAPEPQWGRGTQRSLPPAAQAQQNYPTVEEIQATAPRITERAFPEGSTFYQPNLPNPRGERGQFQSIYGEPKSVIEARRRMAVPVGQPAARAPEVSPGQMAFDALGFQEPTGPLGRQLLESDPQTYKSISEIAVAAQQKFNAPVFVEDLLGPRGTSILNELQTGRAIVPAPRGGLSAPYAPRVEAVLDPEPSDVFRRLAGGAEPPSTSTAAPMSSIDPIAFAVRDFAENPANVASAVSTLRNAVGGVRQGDLSRYTLPLVAGAGAGAAGLGLATYLGSRQGAVPGPQQLTDEQLYPTPELPQTSITPEGIPVEGGNTNLYLPVQGGQDTAPVRPFSPPPGQMGAGSVVIRTNDQESNRRQALANAAAGAGVFQPRPESYSRPRDFYRAAESYARQPGVRESLQEQLAASSARMGQADMQSWVRANPGLAYQLSLQTAPRDISQQTPNIQTAEIVTELGTNNMNNVVGNTSEAVRVAGGASADLKQATDPRLGVSLKPMPRDLQTYFNRPGFAGTTRLY